MIAIYFRYYDFLRSGNICRLNYNIDRRKKEYKMENPTEGYARVFYDSRDTDESMLKAETYFIEALFEYAFSTHDDYTNREIFQTEFADIYEEIVEICETNNLSVNHFLRNLNNIFYDNLKAVFESNMIDRSI